MPSIWDKITFSDTTDTNSNIVFIGRESTGKTTIRHFLDPSKRTEEITKTIGLDYSWGKRTTNPSLPDVIANFYEIGGGFPFANLIDIPLNPHSVSNCAFVIVTDLSKPWTVFQDIEWWLGLIERRVSECLRGLAEINPTAAETFQRNRRRRSVRGDGMKVDWCGVPIAVFGTHFDVFESEQDMATRQLLSDALRVLCASHHLSLFYFSAKVQNKIPLSFLKHISLGTVAPRFEQPEQISLSQIAVIAGTDTLNDIEIPVLQKNESTSASSASSFSSPFSSLSSSSLTGDPSSKAKQLVADKIKRPAEKKKNDMLLPLNFDKYQEPSLDSALAEIQSSILDEKKSLSILAASAMTARSDSAEYPSYADLEPTRMPDAFRVAALASAPSPSHSPSPAAASRVVRRPSSPSAPSSASKVPAKQVPSRTRVPSRPQSASRTPSPQPTGSAASSSPTPTVSSSSASSAATAASPANGGAPVRRVVRRVAPPQSSADGTASPSQTPPTSSSTSSSASSSSSSSSSRPLVKTIRTVRPADGASASSSSPPPSARSPSQLVSSDSSPSSTPSPGSSSVPATQKPRVVRKVAARPLSPASSSSAAAASADEARDGAGASQSAMSSSTPPPLTSSAHRTVRRTAASPPASSGTSASAGLPLSSSPSSSSASSSSSSSSASASGRLRPTSPSIRRAAATPSSPPPTSSRASSSSGASGASSSTLHSSSAGTSSTSRIRTTARTSAHSVPQRPPPKPVDDDDTYDF
ncbi:D2LIC, cytoplasmic dynein 2 light intermediate chain 1 [Monocercomonoides exilis]|uniref:D2LIC, cytoplasmic dynein 2 light intermediate chain 1 n=1 Tax=Monocercomonoides exilis TaxID=2049356 RepID=UPI00355949C4|nr:D2LIC, cytoplasmic dynein 2 light intermediate chain 1 [Monocercomonoides exilis]|eukprot:MONOS_7656.1-p1 / transcript=MONOS_7656.1 / gene=MONOS_7656 / organism=Monocercomonoides_exilis_PA203 / gene_product=D2LIC, cytoplasmic dynein 2 light intermediate chain 1 / transcript_product=D2LIC, cytoplasmic dynein 2 light intermediate chain 1 / location=Mono_scaffold00267:35940-39219(-) / protein_length=755 / sequence_SO=supercontig / SO=protein_coding / is_pseudo=false